MCVTRDTRRGITSYYWTDNPRWLLYLQDTDGNEDWHLYRVDLDHPDEPAIDLTPMDPGSRGFAVDPETTVPGTVIAWMNPRPLFADVFRIDVATGSTTPLVERTNPTETFLLDRTGRASWYLSQDADGTYEIAAADPDTGSKQLIHRAGGPEHPMGIFVLPTPDGSAALIGDYQDTDTAGAFRCVDLPGRYPDRLPGAVEERAQRLGPGPRLCHRAPVRDRRRDPHGAPVRLDRRSALVALSAGRRG